MRKFKAFIIAFMSLFFKERITRRGRCHVEMSKGDAFGKKTSRIVIRLLSIIYDVRRTVSGKVHIELRQHNREGKM
jgi:hypothetical protein